MPIWGKILGALLGWGMAGPMGLVLGVIAGHFFDKGLSGHLAIEREAAKVKGIFFKTTFMIMGYIAKADGRVSEEDIAMARHLMVHLHLTPIQTKEAMRCFYIGKAPDFEWEEQMQTFIQYCGYHPQLVRLFIEMQLQAAFAEGVASPKKRYILERLCHLLHVPSSLLEQLEKRFHAERRYEEARQQRQYRAPSPREGAQYAYELLGISPTATDQEVKRAYRKLMSQHHPDKWAAKGLPESMIKMTTEKAQTIRKAYEQICALRGMK